MFISNSGRLRLGSPRKVMRLQESGPGGSSSLTYSEKVALIAPNNLIGWWKQAESYSAVAGTGTIAQTLTAILGVGTAFLSQLQIGDLLVGTGVSGYVAAIADDTHLTLSSSTTVGATAFTYTRNISIDSSRELNNGLYRAVTLGQTGIGDGLPAASYDSITSFDNIFSSALAADFNGAEGSLACWGKVGGAGVWSDAVSRNLAFFRTDGNNQISMTKSATANQLRVYHAAAGTVKTFNIATSTLGLFFLGLTWSQSGDVARAFFNTAQSGADQNGLGAYAGAITSAFIGAQTAVPANVFSGILAHCLLYNTPLTVAQMLSLATVP